MQTTLLLDNNVCIVQKTCQTDTPFFLGFFTPQGEKFQFVRKSSFFNIPKYVNRRFWLEESNYDKI